MGWTTFSLQLEFWCPLDFLPLSAILAGLYPGRITSKTANVCQDFYKFACGDYLVVYFPIPSFGGLRVCLDVCLGYLGELGVGVAGGVVRC